MSLIRAAVVGLILVAWSAESARGVSGIERQVLEEMNLARTSPSRYADLVRTFRARFQGKSYRIGSNTFVQTAEGVKAVDEAVRFLARQKPLPPLSWSDGLAAAAAELAEETGESGETGHRGRRSGDLRQRVERYGAWSGQIGENIGYGPDEARLMVISLIVDDGVADRGHRTNIFSPAFKMAGVACGFHKRYRHLCVVDFATRLREREEKD